MTPIPTPPPGFELDASPASAPPPPQGFILDAAPAPSANPTPPPPPPTGFQIDAPPPPDGFTLDAPAAPSVQPAPRIDLRAANQSALGQINEADAIGLPFSKQQQYAVLTRAQDAAGGAVPTRNDLARTVTTGTGPLSQLANSAFKGVAKPLVEGAVYAASQTSAGQQVPDLDRKLAQFNANMEAGTPSDPTLVNQTTQAAAGLVPFLAAARLGGTPGAVAYGALTGAGGRQAELGERTDITPAQRQAAIVGSGLVGAATGGIRLPVANMIAKPIASRLEGAVGQAAARMLGGLAGSEVEMPALNAASTIAENAVGRASGVSDQPLTAGAGQSALIGALTAPVLAPAVGQHLAADAQRETALRQFVGRVTGTDPATVTMGQRPRGEAGYALRALESLAPGKVVYFNGGKENRANGFVDQGHIFINTDRPADSLASVMGHEILGHAVSDPAFQTALEQWRQNNPKLQEWGEQTYAQEAAGFRDNISPDLLREEGTARVLQEALSDPAAAAKLREVDPGFMGRIGDATARVVDTLTGGNAAKRRLFGRQMKALDALAEYGRENKNPVPADVTAQETLLDRLDAQLTEHARQNQTVEQQRAAAATEQGQTNLAKTQAAEDFLDAEEGARAPAPTPPLEAQKTGVTPEINAQTPRAQAAPTPPPTTPPPSPQQSPTSPPPTPKTGYTSIPREWHGATLYDWGKGPVLAKGTGLPGPGGRRTRYLPPEYRNQLERVPLNKTDVVNALKTKDAPTWKVEGSKGKYLLAPRDAVREVKQELGVGDFYQATAPPPGATPPPAKVLTRDELMGLSYNDLKNTAEARGITGVVATPEMIDGILAKQQAPQPAQAEVRPDQQPGGRAEEKLRPEVTRPAQVEPPKVQDTSTDTGPLPPKPDDGIPFSVSAFHGSPHDFDEFKLNDETLGSGEGAQAYGHGLYFAGRKEVAEHYRKTLSKGEVRYDDRPFEPVTVPDTLAARALNGADGDRAAAVQHLEWLRGHKQSRRSYDATDQDIDRAIEAVGRLQYRKGRLYDVELAPDEHEFLDWDKPLSQQSEHTQRALAAAGFTDNSAEVDALRKQVESVTAERRALIGEPEFDRAKYDELNSQGQRLVGKIHDLGGNTYGTTNGVNVEYRGKTGQQIYAAIADAKSREARNLPEWMKGTKVANDRAASDHLHSLGVRGIRYLDGSSRGTSGGEIVGVYQDGGKWLAKVRVTNRGGAGFQSPTDSVTTSKPYTTRAEAEAWAKEAVKAGSHNYVIFNDKDVKVRAKFSLAGRESLATLPEKERKAQEYNLDVAEEMYKHGIEPNKVRLATGWFKGPYDGKWRTELDDSQMKFKVDPADWNDALLRKNGVEEWDGRPLENAKPLTLDDVVDHPPLFKAYPALRKLPVSAVPNLGYEGLFDGHKIKINAGAEDPAGTLLHEIQHAIQNMEGFAKGANTLAVRNTPEYQAAMQQAQGRAKREKPSWTEAPAENNEDVIAHRVYQRYAGEIEARDTAARADFTGPQRRQVRPFASTGIKPEDAIVRYSVASEAGVPEGKQDDPRYLESARKQWAEKGTESPFFKRWFGGSKVVDEAGKPLVVYHGTTGMDRILESGFKPGWVHLADSKAVADSYQSWDRGGSAGTLALYVKAENPAHFDAKGQKYTDIGNKVFRATWDAEKAGHDAMIIKNIRDNNDSSVPTEPHTTVVAFSPEQIKSATGNRGTFDAGNPDIRYSVGKGEKPAETIDDLKTRFPDVKLDLSENDDRITLSRVIVPKEGRQQGTGTAVMRELTRYADAKGKTIALTPSTDFGASSVGRLKEFYKRFGFVENRGRNRDFGFRESMYRPAAKGRPLPEMRKLPESGQYPAVRTDDGSIYFDQEPGGRTHLDLIRDQRIPPERVVGGGWIVDGDYRSTDRSDSQRIGDQARAKARVGANPDEVLGGPRFSVARDALDKAKEIGGAAHDYITHTAVPKLRRAGVADEAVAHAYARVYAPHEVRNLLAHVFPDAYGAPEKMAPVVDVLNKDNILAGYDSFNERADAAEKAGDDSAAADYRAAADAIAGRHDLGAYANDVQSALADPQTAAAIGRWKQHVNPLLDRLYNEMKAVDPNTPREGRGRYTDARVNLLDKQHEPAVKESLLDPDKPLPELVGNLRNPAVKRDRYDRAASFLGDYSTDANLVLSKVLGPRLNEVTKLRMYDALQKKGLAVMTEPGEERPEKVGWRKAITLPVEVPQTNPDTGKTAIVRKNLAVREDVYREVRDVLGVDMKLPQNPVARALTQLQLMQLADAFTHTKNLFTRPYWAQGAGSATFDVVKANPLVGVPYTAYKLFESARDVMRDTPEVRDRVARMAKQGLIRPDYEHAGLVKKLADKTGQGWLANLSTGKFLHQIDTAARVTLDKFYDNLVAQGRATDTPAERYRFVSQVGEYNRRLLGPMARTMRDAGFSPFVVAGRNFNAAGRRILTGDPGFSGGGKSRAVQFAMLASMAALPAILNAITTGTPAGRSGTPLGAWDTGRDDEKGNRVTWDVAQMVGLRRGLKSTGLDAIGEGLMEGKDANQITGNALEGIVQAGAHPWVGPAPGTVFAALTGRRLDLRGKMEARTIPGGGGAQFAENARAALASSNPFLYSAIGSPGAGEEDSTGSYLGDVAGAVARTPTSGLGIKGVRPGTNAAEDLAGTLARQKMGEGLTPEEAARVKVHSDLAARLRADPEAGKKELDALVSSGKIGPKEAANIARKGGMSPLAWNVRGLSADDAMRVWEKATPEQKKEMLPAIHEKVMRSTVLAADDRRAAQDRLAADAQDVDPAYARRMKFDREYADLKERDGGREQYKKLLSEAAASARAGNGARARELRQQAVTALRSAKLTAAERSRLARLEARMRMVHGIERQAKAGAITRDEAERRIARVVAV